MVENLVFQDHPILQAENICKFNFSIMLDVLQIAVIPNCSILAAVGQKMASTPGVSATLFSALAKVGKLSNFRSFTIFSF